MFVQCGFKCVHVARGGYQASSPTSLQPIFRGRVSHLDLELINMASLASQRACFEDPCLLRPLSLQLPGELLQPPGIYMSFWGPEFTVGVLTLWEQML